VKISLLIELKIKHRIKMTKEIRKDLYTQAEYAKKIGLTRGRVNQMVKAGELKTVTVNGATLIKVG
jgi:predicted XRE-type DNA-binding protein